MVDAADESQLDNARVEFDNLLERPLISGIPCLVLANKRDLPGALDERQMIEKLLALCLSSDTVQGCRQVMKCEGCRNVFEPQLFFGALLPAHFCDIILHYCSKSSCPVWHILYTRPMQYQAQFGIIFVEVYRIML